ncbi:unnamed protein product, partial [Ectocarpus sp. 6 AP-2014]
PRLRANRISPLLAQRRRSLRDFLRKTRGLLDLLARHRSHYCRLRRRLGSSDLLRGRVDNAGDRFLRSTLRLVHREQHRLLRDTLRVHEAPFSLFLPLAHLLSLSALDGEKNRQ